MRRGTGEMGERRGIPGTRVTTRTGVYAFCFLLRFVVAHWQGHRGDGVGCNSDSIHRGIRESRVVKYNRQPTSPSSFTLPLPGSSASTEDYGSTTRPQPLSSTHPSPYHPFQRLSLSGSKLAIDCDCRPPLGVRSCTTESPERIYPLSE